MTHRTFRRIERGKRGGRPSWVVAILGLVVISQIQNALYRSFHPAEAARIEQTVKSWYEIRAPR